MQWVIIGSCFHIDAVCSQGVLGKVIGADGEKVHILRQPVSQVIIVSGLTACCRVGNRSQRAGVIVGISYCVAVLKGFPDNPAILVIGILDIVTVAVSQLLQITVSIVCIVVGRQRLVVSLLSCLIQNRGFSTVCPGGE